MTTKSEYTERHVIGFTKKMYTLWTVIESDNYTLYNYRQNLSLDLDKAIENAKKIIFDICNNDNDPNIQVDLELRGASSFKLYNKPSHPADCFSFGKLAGEKISESDDIWQLSRARNEETTEERRQLALDRLVELKAVKEYNGDFLTLTEIEDIEENKRHEKGLGHHYKHGERVLLKNVRITNSHSFEGMYGTTYIKEFINEDDLIFKYIGTSPPVFKYLDEDGCYNYPFNENFKADILVTIKHTFYNDMAETHIQRIKVKNIFLLNK